MATTFQVLYLGTAPALDVDEGNHTSENASAIVGQTFGAAGDPLYDHVHTFSPGSVGYTGGISDIAYETNNADVNETFRIDGGPDQVMDGAALYTATLTYVDGTTATIDAAIFQDSDGHLYHALELTDNSDQAALEAKPIQSITLDALDNATIAIGAERHDGSFMEAVDGTSGDDKMAPGYTDAEGDQIDGTDGDADWVEAGGGNDFVSAGAGDDTIVGGTGNDVMAGDAGADTFLLEDGFGNDTIDGGTDGTPGAEPTDTIDASAVTADLKVVFDGDQTGALTDGTDTVSFTEVEGVVLGQGDDTLDASLENSGMELSGLGGNDSILGSGGADAIDGGTGADTLEGNDGADTITGGAGADVLSGGSGDDVFVFANGFGNDTIAGGEAGETSGDTLDFSAVTVPLKVIFTGDDAGTVSDGTDTITFSGIETLVFGPGADHVSAGGDSDGMAVAAGDGADTVWGGTGGDTVSGGAGSDEIFGDAGADSISGGDGNDDLGGDAGNDTIDGGAGNDWIQGNAGTNVLSGGGGDDTFEIITNQASGDRIDGGETGEVDGDRIVFTGPDGAQVALSGDEAGKFSAGQAFGTFSNIEAVELTDNDDIFDGAAASTGLDLDGGAGNDALTGGTGDDTLQGGAGADTIRAGAGDDSLSGGEGNDAIYGYEGSDTVDGGAGDDYINTRTSTGTGLPDTGLVFPDDPATLQDESALLSYGADSDPTNDRDSVAGGAGHDTILTGDDDDTIDGGTGDDSIDAGYDDDVVWGGDGADTLEGNEGADAIDGGAGDDVIYGSIGPDNPDYALSQLFELADGIDPEPGNNADTLSGGIGNDRIFGQDDGDLLDGGDGNDTLDGGIDDDTLTGGAGEDTFVLSDGGGADVITDFDLGDDDADGVTNDQLDLSGLTDTDGNPVDIWDVVVSDTVGDGSGDPILSFPNGESLTLTNVDPALLDAQMMQAMGIPCLVAGTLIDTPDGDRPVEDLAPGDLVTTLAGAEPVRWTGQRALDAEALGRRPEFTPVRIREGALGNRRDLLVSPQHRIAIGRGGAPERFAPARWLAEDGDGRFRVSRGCRGVTYVHILLPRHAVIRAEGAWVESFFPGPEGLAALGACARADLCRLCPAFAGIRTFDDAQRIYGPLALRRIKRRDLGRFLDGRMPARATGVAAE